MRYSSSEKLEIIGLVETSGLPVRRTLVQLGIPKATFYDGYRRYLEDGIDGLKHQQPKPVRVWNKVSEETGSAIVELALQAPELSPRELAVRYTDTARYLVFEGPGSDHSPSFIVRQAADKFSHPTTRVNRFKIIDWGWYYLSTVLDDCSRLILAWRGHCQRKSG